MCGCTKEEEEEEEKEKERAEKNVAKENNTTHTSHLNICKSNKAENIQENEDTL